MIIKVNDNFVLLLFTLSNSNFHLKLIYGIKVWSIKMCYQIYVKMFYCALGFY